MSEIIKILPLGGLDENGRDCYIIEIDGDMFVVDAGFSVPDKSIPGIDFMLPNMDYIIKNKDHLRAYIITHGHDENMGCLQFVYDTIPAPIYCTNATRIIIEAEATRFRLKPNFSFRIVEPSDKLLISGHEVQFFQTMHNASYSFGVAFKTSQGNIIYTGDYIIDFTSQDKAYFFDLAKVEELAKEKTLILLSESKGASKAGYCSPKHDAYSILAKPFKETKKRIFITCFWQNFYRINEICKLAKTTNKKIYFYNEYTRNVMSLLMSANESLCLKQTDIIKKEDLLRYPNRDVVILLLGRGVKLYEELKKIVNKTNEDHRIVLGADDLFINVALPTPQLETIATESMDSLYRNDCEVLWLKGKDVKAMHAQEGDIKFLLSMFRPKYYLPIRGSYVNVMANAKLAFSMNIGLTHNNIFVIDNGMQVIINKDGRAEIVSNEVNGINIAPVLVDGVGISKLASQVIEERKRLGADGVVVIASTISRSQQKIISGPDCQMRGFVFSKEAEPLLKFISQIYVEEVKMALISNVTSYEKAISNIQERCQRFIRKENGRQPLILPIIIPQP